MAELFASGELAALVRRHRTLRSLAAHLGMERKALASLMDRMRQAGEVGSWEEMLFGAVPDIQKPDIGAVPVTGTPVPAMGTNAYDSSPAQDKWPSVAAFDAEAPVDTLPEGHTLRGVSTLVGPDGEVKAQWIKTRAEDDDRQRWLTALLEIGDAIERIEPAPEPGDTAEDLLVVLPAGDPHVGLLAWHEDAGENFNMEIAERNLVAAFSKLIDLAPAAATALLIFIGDNTHSDGQGNTTTRGTRVDVDGRTVKMMRTTIRACRRAIDLSLRKFGRSHVIVERGNHDELLSAMLALALSLAYENEPRVTVDVSPEVFHWFRFGQVLIGTHHGDKVKPADLLGVMAVDRQADWGETSQRRFYCGHLHHLQTKEVPGLIVETLPTLAAADAWHRSMGYRSQRAMYMDVFHRDGRHINRHFVGIEAR